VISVLATRTGAGKSPASRFVAGVLMAQGIQPAVIRHPMPYGTSLPSGCRGSPLCPTWTGTRHGGGAGGLRTAYPSRSRSVAGVDYQAIVEEAQKEASVIIWDGGNNDFSSFPPISRS